MRVHEQRAEKFMNTMDPGDIGFRMWEKDNSEQWTDPGPNLHLAFEPKDIGAGSNLGVCPGGLIHSSPVYTMMKTMAHAFKNHGEGLLGSYSISLPLVWRAANLASFGFRRSVHTG